MPALIPIILAWIKANPWIKWVIGIIATLALVIVMVTHEVHNIQAKQKLADALKQEQIFNIALKEENARDQVIINTYDKQVEALKNQFNKERTDAKTIITNNQTWANTPLPLGIDKLGD